MLEREIDTMRIPSIDIPVWETLERIAIDECGERLVPLSLSDDIVSYPAYYKMGIKYAVQECFVRESVFDKLLVVARSLPDGIRLVVLDGWRPIHVQEYLYETLINQLKRAPIHAEKSLSELSLIARTLVSPPSTNANCPSPHQTGGSVDVTLCDSDGRLLDMGTQFDENSLRSWSSALEDSPETDQAQNRRLLYNAMIEAGFTNLPSEWWHYDYGNQMWANYTGRNKAIYGATRPLTIEHLWNIQEG
ncbi:D-alanyl-D-alanine dipeptidase [Vibrio maritimus]|uniref:D-alanyl-D-alanine dipeptidase n=1 Tax=Vibrio maritimus TaxID=990268 RepID=A0A090S7P1_9VIBR|nr:D-alanyl-D-alanine dipeptidase [Vibrio maritimus]